MTTREEQPRRPVQWSLRSILAAVALFAAWFAWWRAHLVSAMIALLVGATAAIIVFNRRVLKLRPFVSVAIALALNVALWGGTGLIGASLDGPDEELGADAPWIMLEIGVVGGLLFGLLTAFYYGIYLLAPQSPSSRQAKPEESESETLLSSGGPRPS